MGSTRVIYKNLIKQGQGVYPRKGGGVEVPNQDQALFSLQSISGNNMIDSVNGWEFPINGKDWEDTDYIGLYYLPYKSEATISPPADGTPAATAIQAVDTENFWYEPGGTARQIPIQAFFNNPDFIDKTFCATAQRFTLGWGVETLPTGVAYITMYNSAQTITSAFTTFFGSDIEPTVGAKFVSKTGNDTTGDGSQSTPWLTLEKARSTLTGTGGKVYVSTGVYQEDSGSGYLSFDNVDDDFTFQGTGDVSITSSDTARVVYSRATILRFHNIYINGEGTTTRLLEGYFNWGATNAYPMLYMYKMRFAGATNDWGGGLVDLMEVHDSVHTEYIEFYAPQRKSVEFKGNLLNQIRITNANASVTYNKFTEESNTDTQHINDIKEDITISYNHFKCNGICIETDNVVSRTGDFTLTVHYNTFEHDFTTGANTMQGGRSIHADAVWDMQYNRLLGTSVTSAGNQTEYLFTCTQLGTTSNISNNYIRSYVHGIQTFINFNPGQLSVVNVTRNYIHSDAEDGQFITCSEGENTDRLNGSTFAYNVIIGHYNSRGYGTSGGAHGMLVNQGKNFKVYGNFFWNLPLAFVYKNRYMTNTENGVWGNFFYNCMDCIYVRRSDGGWVYNNTFVWDSNAPASNTRAVFKCDDQYATSSDSDSWKLTNNIVVYAGNQPYSTVLWFGHADNLIDFEANDNVFYGIDTNEFIWDTDTDTKYTVAQSITNGWAADVDTSDPGISSIPDEPWPTTPISGTSLAAVYEPSLGYETDWEAVINGLTLPDPEVTSNTSGSWEKGAYVEAT